MHFDFELREYLLDVIGVWKAVQSDMESRDLTSIQRSPSGPARGRLFNDVSTPICNWGGWQKKGGIDAEVSALEQFQILLPATELTEIDVEFVQQFEIEVAKGCWLFEDRLTLVAIAATGDDGGQIVASMVGRIAKVAPDDNSGVVQQGAAAFFDLIEIV